METNSWTTAAKPKTYRQAPNWLKFYEEAVIESEEMDSSMPSLSALCAYFCVNYDVTQGYICTILTSSSRRHIRIDVVYFLLIELMAAIM